MISNIGASFSKVVDPNCSQKVLMYWSKEFDVSPIEVAAFAKCGKGKAPGGLCGALYGAKNLIRDEKKRILLTQEFETAAKSIRCKEIRKIGVYSCDDCIAKGIELVGKYK